MESQENESPVWNVDIVLQMPYVGSSTESL